MTRSVLTIACGKPIYIEMAETLARSFRVHHSDSEIRFLIATDQPSLFSPDIRKWVDFAKVQNDSSLGFELKLDLDVYSSADQTLFVDADCLVTGKLEPLFSHLQGQHFATFGKNLNRGEWFGDIADRCKAVGSSFLPVFVGATYYFEKTKLGLEVLKVARDHVSRYDELGIIRLRGRRNEEPLISIGMGKCGISALPDNGDIKCDAMAFDGPVQVNVFGGASTFECPKKDFFLKPSSSAECRPLIAHFNCSFASMWEYRREALALRLHFAHSLPQSCAIALARIRHEVVGRFVRCFKPFLRPVYRRIFGVRTVKSSKRI